MDVRKVLIAARGQAGFDQRRLALAAGTARTTVVAYETGARSPTVRQLTRLLAACGVQARVVLEPLTGDVDALLDEALAGGVPEAFERLGVFTRAWAQAGVAWALDGASAVAAQGLALPHATLVVVLVDDDVSRRWFRHASTRVWNRDGFSVALHWYESAERLAECMRRPLFTRLGWLQVRFVEAMPQPVLVVQVEGQPVPVLPLAEVRRAHPQLAELLQRHDERRAAG